MTERSGAGKGQETPPHESDTSGIAPDEEPTTTGTLFVMLLFLMALAGMWALMYMVLLER